MKKCLEIWISSTNVTQNHEFRTYRAPAISANFSLAMVALRGDGHSIVSLVAEVLVRCHEAATLFWPQKTASTQGRATDELYDDMVFVGGLR